jgi:hypothetical protein
MKLLVEAVCVAAVSAIAGTYSREALWLTVVGCLLALFFFHRAPRHIAKWISGTTDVVGSEAEAAYELLDADGRAALRRLTFTRKLPYQAMPGLASLESTPFAQREFSGHYEINAQFVPWLEEKFSQSYPRQRAITGVAVGVTALYVVGAGIWMWRQALPPAAVTGSPKSDTPVRAVSPPVVPPTAGNAQPPPTVKPSPKPVEPSQPAVPPTPARQAQRRIERVSNTSVQFQRPETLSGIPFKANAPIGVRGRVVNRGAETARTLSFHVWLHVIELPPSVETEEVVWKAYTGLLRDFNEGNDLGTQEDRYLDAETPRVPADDAMHLNAGRYHVYFVGVARFQDKEGELRTEMCFYWQPDGAWMRCARHNRVGVVTR